MAVDEGHEERGEPTARAAHGSGTGVDWKLAVEGALWTLVVALPPVWLVLVLQSGDLPGEESDLWLLTPVALLAGFAVGGFVSGRGRPDTPFVHAVAAGTLAFATMAVFGIGRRLLGDGEGMGGADLVRLALLAQICLSTALLGGYVAARCAARAARP